MGCEQGDVDRVCVDRGVDRGGCVERVVYTPPPR